MLKDLTRKDWLNILAVVDVEAGVGPGEHEAGVVLW